MKLFIVLLLCLSVLLSSCISMNTAMFKPKPDSSGDKFLAGWGGFWNMEISMYGAMGITWAGAASLNLESDVAFFIACMSFVSLFERILSADISYRNSMLYRYYSQDTEAE